jgi:hypothetical protein
VERPLEEVVKKTRANAFVPGNSATVTLPSDEPRLLDQCKSDSTGRIKSPDLIQTMPCET